MRRPLEGKEENVKYSWAVCILERLAYLCTTRITELATCAAIFFSQHGDLCGSCSIVCAGGPDTHRSLMNWAALELLPKVGVYAIIDAIGQWDAAKLSPQAKNVLVQALNEAGEDQLANMFSRHYI